MTKRRRMDSEEFGSRVRWSTSQNEQSQRYSTPFGSNPAGDVEFSSGVTAGGATTQDNAPGASAALNENADPISQWNASGASPYPDVSSYSQQPYFYQQTDPSTYNSPWSPAETGTFGSQASSYSLPAPVATMPFFPPQASAETSEGTLETTDIAQPSYQNYQQDIETSAPYLAYAQPPTSNVSKTESTLPPPRATFWRRRLQVTA